MHTLVSRRGTLRRTHYLPLTPAAVASSQADLDRAEHELSYDREADRLTASARQEAKDARQQRRMPIQEAAE